MTTDPMQTVRAALERQGIEVCGTSARCPAHDDTTPSLSITKGDRQAVIVKCHAGCDTQDIVAALGLTMADLCDPATRLKASSLGDPIARYSYTDADGTVLYEVVRYAPKTFRQRRPDGRGGWTWDLKGVDRVLYRLPQVVAAVAAGETVYIAEGERDVETLERAGVVATCNSGGAGKFEPRHAAVLSGADVVIVADNDPAGHRHAAQVDHLVRAAGARSVRVVRAATGNDVTDHLAAGHTIDELVDLDLDDEVDTPAERVDEHDDKVSTWAEVDLGPALRGELHPPRPSILRRTDELGLIYAGELNGLHGDSGAGKSWLALVAAVEIIRDGGSVVWVDAEDPTPATLVERLRAAGLTDEQIVAGVAYIAPAEPSDEAAIAQVVRTARSRDDVRLVVLDSVGELHALDGVNENSDEDVAPWMRRVARALVELTGAAVLLIDHATKAGDAPLYPSGSKRKRAAITGAQHLVTADPPFARGTPGRLVVTCAKDRHGHHQRGAIVAYVQIRPTANGGIAWTVEPPTPPTPAAERLQQQQRDRELGEQLEVVNALRRARRPLTRTDLGHRVELRRELVPKVVARLVDHGAVVEVDHVRPNAAGQRRTVTVLRLADGTGWQPDNDDTQDDPDGGSR